MVQPPAAHLLCLSERAYWFELGLCMQRKMAKKVAATADSQGDGGSEAGGAMDDAGLLAQGNQVRLACAALGRLLSFFLSAAAGGFWVADAGKVQLLNLTLTFKVK